MHIVEGFLQASMSSKRSAKNHSRKQWKWGVKQINGRSSNL